MSLYVERPRLAVSVAPNEATSRAMAFWVMRDPLTYTRSCPLVPSITVVYRLSPAGVRAPAVAAPVAPAPTSVLHGDPALVALVMTDLT